MTSPPLFALVLTLFAVSASAESLLKPRGKAGDLLPVDQAFQFDGVVKKDGAVALEWTVAPGYYLYEHMFKVSVDVPAGTPAPKLKAPPGEKKVDAEFGDVVVHRGQLKLPLAFASSKAAPRTLRVRYQGCADIGVCYPPQTRLVALKP